MTKDDDFPTIPGYVPIKEAAKILGISNPRMYGYVRDKRITALKAGRTLMIPMNELENFKLNPPGRVRTKAADWRIYNIRSKLHWHGHSGAGATWTAGAADRKTQDDLQQATSYIPRFPPSFYLQKRYCLLQ